MRKAYQTISIPRNLIRAIDRMIGTGVLAYTSRGEYVKELVRKDLKSLIRHKILSPELLSTLEDET